MASVLASKAAFRERAEECGLTEDEIKALTDKSLDNMAALAFACRTPGTTPSEDSLKGLLSERPDSVSVRALSAIRKLMFECQTLSVAQLKSAIEHGPDQDKRAELPAAERSTRIKEQRTRLSGMFLSGPAENAYGNYNLVAAVLEQDFLSYLEPHRFLTRAAEVSKERPGKEIILDEGQRLSIRDKNHKDKCSISNELQLAEALTRRALACDVMRLCSFSNLESWHKLLFSHLSRQPPPHYSRVSMEQVLRCDKAAWVKMAEDLPTLKRDASGHLPMDKALDALGADPSVMFHVMPLPGPSLRQDTKGKGKGNRGTKRTAEGEEKKPNGGKGADKGLPTPMPAALKDPRLKHNCSKSRKRLCWNFNLTKGCSFAKCGESCKRGLRQCMYCEGAHSLAECPTFKQSE